MISSKACEKYLRDWAEPECQFLSNLDVPERQFALVIPALDEDIHFIDRLSQHERAHELLLILVLNAPAGDERNYQQNFALAAALHEKSSSGSRSGNLSLMRYDALEILLVNRYEHGIPRKQGVGLARKIGADIALQLIQNQLIHCPWIFNTDADAGLPAAYFDAIAECPGASACCYRFVHEGDDSLVTHATKLYEACLHYYCEQLRWAGSPYAYQSLGSCIAVSAQHYAAARGFPKRAAAEDFYLLNKLAKLAPIHESDCCIALQARLSQRAPFGTGPAVQQLCEQLERREIPTYYAQECFSALKQVLDTVPQQGLNSDCCATLPANIQSCLTEAGIEAFLEKRKAQDHDAAAFQRSFHEWFDAFQTLKFIRRMQAYYPAKPIKQWHTKEIFYT